MVAIDFRCVVARCCIRGTEIAGKSVPRPGTLPHCHVRASLIAWAMKGVYRVPYELEQNLPTQSARIMDLYLSIRAWETLPL